MKRYIAILRGINVGGRNRVLMADLKHLCINLGFSNVVTYIQSGNVIFNTDLDLDNLGLADLIENAITKEYKINVLVIVMTGSELQQAVELNPFIEGSNIERLCITFLKHEPDKEIITGMNNTGYLPDSFEIIGKCVFIFCSGKYSESKLTNKLFENKLKVMATTRNLKTIMKIKELSGE